MLPTSLLALTVFGCRLAGAVPNVEQSRPSLPDFSQYIDMRTLTRKDLGVDDARRRILFVGDIHGMLESLQQLLAKAHYNPRRDTLIHTGDIVTKGFDSLGVLEWLSSHNILGVRGNHDEKVLEWRGWIEWVSSQRGGIKWIKNMELEFPEGVEGRDLRHKKRWRRFPIPNDWTFNGEAFHIAKNMSPKHYKYLLNLPLTLHLAPLHTLVVHAGLLPMDPTRKPTSKSQPLAHLPDVDHPKPPTRLLRLAQEAAIVTEIPQNTKAWARMNMRSILEDGTVTRDGEAGEPWPIMWNVVMGMCNGFDSIAGLDSQQDGQLVLNQKPKVHLPCHPATVVYGHSAARGLDINRWSKGIDTGCVYGRKLTALVLSNKRKHFLDETMETENIEETDFSDDRVARILRVRCPVADDSFSPFHNGTQ